ncbi:MAG: aminopeptidase, partial [Ketobacter sp.]
MALSGSDADPRLQALAHLAVTVGVNIQPQQPLIISAPWEARQWVQEACRAAYQAGSGWVQTVYEDPELLRVALMTMDSVPQSALPSPEHALLSRSPDAAHLRILGPRPTLLEGISAQRLVDFHGLLKAGNTSTFHTVRCCSVPFVTEDWARFVRPGLDTAAAMDALWNDVFELCAVVGAEADSRALQARLERNEQITQWLNTQQFDWIQFQNNGSELTVGLLKNTAWQGARIRAQSVVPFLSAIPLEPVHCLLDPL